MNRKNIKQTILEYFLINPTSKMRVRELERFLRLPLPSIIRYCKELKDENIIATEKIGNVLFFKASRTDEYVLEKKIYNLKALYKSGLIEYLKQELSNPPIILFGSYSKGEDVENSDIDIYLETQSKKPLNIEQFKKILKREIQLFKHKSIHDVPNKSLANNIINGIIVNSYVDVLT